MNKTYLGSAAALGVVFAAMTLFPPNATVAPTRPHIRAVPRRVVQPPPEPTALTAPPGAPAITDVTYQPVTPHTAEEINRAVPVLAAGPPARPFMIVDGTASADRALHCLTQTIYYEAGSESEAGQRAVAQVVLNRMRSPAFPATVCGVVYQGSDRKTGCQFTFTCDGSLARRPTPSGWTRATDVAQAALHGRVYAPVGHATHYHADYVVPYWASSMAKIRVVGLHDFYRWAGNWRPTAYFSQSYGNLEPDVPGLPAGTTSALTDGLALSASRPTPRSGPARTLAVDQKPAVLIAPGKSRLDPALERVVVLRADLEAEPLPPARRVGLPR